MPEQNPAKSVRKRMSMAEAWLDKLKQPLSGKPPEGQGPENRHGRPKIPVGQRPVSKWPVLDIGGRPEIAREDWRLEITGHCQRPMELDWEALMALPQVEEESDFHCVTAWSAMDLKFSGVRFRDLAERAQPHDDAVFVFVTASDRLPGSDIPYTTGLSLVDALESDVLLVHSWNSQPLPIEHGGPVRMITPKLYAWKGAKWIEKIEFLTEERLGFWEQRGYSSTARPWLNDRFTRR